MGKKKQKTTWENVGVKFETRAGVMHVNFPQLCIMIIIPNIFKIEKQLFILLDIGWDPL